MALGPGQRAEEESSLMQMSRNYCFCSFASRFEFQSLDFHFEFCFWTEDPWLPALSYFCDNGGQVKKRGRRVEGLNYTRFCRLRRTRDTWMKRKTMLFLSCIEDPPPPPQFVLQTKEKAKLTQARVLPLHNNFSIHEVHALCLPLTKSSVGEHQSQDNHVTLRSRLSQWVQLTDRPRGRPLAYFSWALCKYQERKQGKQELGSNCTHGHWNRKRYNYAYTNVVILFKYHTLFQTHTRTSFWKQQSYAKEKKPPRPLPCYLHVLHQADVVSSRDARDLHPDISASRSFPDRTFLREKGTVLQCSKFLHKVARM